MALFRACSSRPRAMISHVRKPWRQAFMFPFGAPEPFPQPCIRHLGRPLTHGALQGVPARVFAPQRGTALATFRAARQPGAWGCAHSAMRPSPSPVEFGLFITALCRQLRRQKARQGGPGSPLGCLSGALPT